LAPKLSKRCEKALKPGEVLMLENTRFHAGEERMILILQNRWASLGDVYVNDAFGSAIALIPRRKRGGGSSRCFPGFLMEQNWEYFGRCRFAKSRTSIHWPFSRAEKSATRFWSWKLLCPNAKADHSGGGMGEYRSIAARFMPCGIASSKLDRIDTAKVILSKSRLINLPPSG